MLKYFQINKRMIYFGCLENGTPQGLGIRFDNNKSIEVGNFKQGLLDGCAKRIFAEGHVFIGKFFSGIMDKKGYFFNQQRSQWVIFNKSCLLL